MNIPRFPIHFDIACMNQDKQNDVMSRDVQKGKKVVRFHTGTPSMYGATEAQFNLLDKKGIHGTLSTVSGETSRAAISSRQAIILVRDATDAHDCRQYQLYHGQFRDGTQQGRVILLNGASSAGKSTLAATLRGLLNQPSMIFSMDDYLAMSRGVHENALDAVRETGLPFIESFHAAIAEAARKGALVIVDHVIGESPLWLRDLMNRLGSIPCVRIRVNCRRDILLEREQKRTDRTPDAAHAERQHGQIHQNFPHDFSIDTSEASPGECARKLMRLLPSDFLPDRK